MAGGQILAFPIDFDRRPYNTLALPCECVMWRLDNAAGHVFIEFPFIHVKEQVSGRVE